VRTSNLTIVFTDIKGFTERTGRQSHEENQRLLRLHDALLMPVFRAFEGRLVKTIGDAFLVVFEAPTKAVLCGMAIQDRLWDFNRQVPAAEQIHVRVAVNVGEVREDKGDVFGEPVNIAARVEGLADAGEVVFTEAVFLAMNKAEVPAEDRGVHELKGIAHPVRVYRVPLSADRLRPEDPPYAGVGLSRAGKLPPSDPASLAQHKEIVPQLLAATTGLVSRAGDLQRALAPRLRTASGSLLVRAQALLAEGQRRFAALPARARKLALGAALLAILALLFASLRGDAVERAVSSGDLKQARKELSKLPRGAARTYDEGVIEEAEGSAGAAARSYESAARTGDNRGFKKLVSMTKSDKCSARSAAAHALGSLGDTSASSALKRLMKAEFTDEGEYSALGSIFGCSSRRAARDALSRLERE
jgi:class 3 adenylate cyclase